MRDFQLPWWDAETARKLIRALFNQAHKERVNNFDPLLDPNSLDAEASSSNWVTCYAYGLPRDNDAVKLMQAVTHRIESNVGEVVFKFYDYLPRLRMQELDAEIVAAAAKHTADFYAKNACALEWEVYQALILGGLRLPEELWPKTVRQNMRLAAAALDEMCE